MNKTAYDGNTVVSWDKCDWKPKEVLAPQRVRKLSEAIRFGGSVIAEANSYLDGQPCGCAIAMAGVGYGMDPNIWHSSTALFKRVGDKSGHSHEFLKTVERRHCQGEKAASIAAWLEAQGL